MNYRSTRQLLAKKALRLLYDLSDDPKLRGQELKDCSRILCEAGLLLGPPQPFPMKDFVNRVFRDNSLLDGVLGALPLDEIKPKESLSALANFLAGPFYSLE
jgi:hypothetical protein